MKIASTISRYIIALLFLFSGFVKSVDPMGSIIKVGEYINSFSLDFLSVTAYPLGVILCSAEMLIGLLLLFNLRQKLAQWAALLFMSFFTLLTLYIVIYSPVKDCGCFGDAIKLSNEATFIKNIIFLAITIFLFVSSKKTEKGSSSKAFLASIALSLIIPIYSLIWLPVIDFLPYKIGVNIKEAMHIPDDAPKSEYKTTLVYKNITSGELAEFEIDDTTWHDESSWEYVDTKTKLLKQGYEPSISSFNMVDSSGSDVSDDILLFKGKTILAIVKDHNALQHHNAKISLLEAEAHLCGAKFAILSPSTLSGYQDIYNMDETLLKSLLRANNGYIVIEDGTIKGKWPMSAAPTTHSCDAKIYIYILSLLLMLFIILKLK